MSKLLAHVALSAAVALVYSMPISAQNTENTRLLSQPAISASQIAFTYAGDLWVANRDGSGPRRLTTHPGVEQNPRFSPDGQWIALSGQYDGNTDVFMVPVLGGTPTRLTWHPSADVVQDFTPDGSRILPTTQAVEQLSHHDDFSIVNATAGDGATLEGLDLNTENTEFTEDSAVHRSLASYTKIKNRLQAFAAAQPLCVFSVISVFKYNASSRATSMNTTSIVAG